MLNALRYPLFGDAEALADLLVGHAGAGEAHHLPIAPPALREGIFLALLIDLGLALASFDAVKFESVSTRPETERELMLIHCKN